MQPIDEGDANRLMSLIDAALASGSPVTEIAMDHDGTPCRLVLASGVGISWVRGLLGEPATEPKPEPQLLGNPLELPEEARGPSEVEQLRKERDEALARAEKAEAELSTPPQPNHTSDDSRLAAFLRNYDSYEPGTFERMDEAALAELCRRELARGAK